MASKGEARKLLEDATKQHFRMPSQGAAPVLMIARYSRGGQVDSEPRVLECVRGPAWHWEEANQLGWVPMEPLSPCASLRQAAYHVILLFTVSLMVSFPGL